MPAASSLAIAGLALSAAGAYQQYEAGQDAKEASSHQAAAQRQQAALEQRRADIQNARSVRTAVRQARIARAAIVNAGANAGTLNSSGVAGGTSSVTSQNSSNINYFSQMNEINAGVLQTQQAQADAAVEMGNAQATAATGGALGSLGGTIFTAKGGFDTIFGNPKTKK